MMKKSLCGILAGTVLLSSVAMTPTFAEAATTEEKSKTINENGYLNATINVDELKSMGLTQEEIDFVLSETSESGIYLINGVAYDENGNMLLLKERGKLSWAVKAIKASWNKLPEWVQGALGVTGFQKLLDFIDHFTGTIEDAVYEGCKTLGMSSSVAKAVSKVILFIAL